MKLQLVVKSSWFYSYMTVALTWYMYSLAVNLKLSPVMWWDISQTCSDCWWGMWRCLLMTNKTSFSFPHKVFSNNIVFCGLEKNEYYCCCWHTQIIFDSLFGKDLNGKLRVYAVQFVHHICLWSSDKVINMMGPVLLNGMTKLINEDKQVCIHS